MAAASKRPQPQFLAHLLQRVPARLARPFRQQFPQRPVAASPGDFLGKVIVGLVASVHFGDQKGFPVWRPNNQTVAFRKLKYVLCARRRSRQLDGLPNEYAWPQM